MSDSKMVILSGGAGTRLWPLSRENFPKQFYDLSGTGKPLLMDTIDRLESFGKTWILTVQSLAAASQGLLNQYKKTSTILSEPLARNTAAAVAWMTWKAYSENPQTLMGIFPADHQILKKDVWNKALRLALEKAAEGKVVTLGILPSFPATGYGYMELAELSTEDELKAFPVKKFIEKPSLEKAQELIKTKKVVWNAGIFFFQAAVMAEHFKRWMPELWSQIQTIRSDESNLKEIYSRLVSQSIDYGIMEKLEEIFCIPADLGWSDMGSWEEVCEKSLDQATTVQVQAKNNQFRSLQSSSSKQAAFLGVENIIAVDTPDALLIMQKGMGQKVKEIVELLKTQNKVLTQGHNFEERPWGHFEVLLDSSYFKSKLIRVWPGQILSYQSHKRRAEHWILVKGKAEVTLNDEIHRLKAGDHIFIPLEAKHRIANPYEEVMEFIEVQTGTYFGEDDIIRYSDQYGRV